jgi:hypothetical protein
LSSKISAFGDHGLTSILFYKGFLYATYMVQDPKWGEFGCADYGAMDGRPLNQVNGCAITGRLSRWPLDPATGTVSGDEQILIDGNKPVFEAYCVQFSTHAVTSVVELGGLLYVAFGDGAAFTTVDVGQLGNNPCGDHPGFLGAFRCQDPSRLNGKIMSLDPVTLQTKMVSIGHRNPWRLTTFDPADGTEVRLLESETGWYRYEEINQITLDKVHNYGWPCMEGPEVTPEYVNFQVAICQTLKESTQDLYIYKGPVFSYAHPIPLPPGNVASISAIAGYGRIYFGDFTQGWIHSISANYDDEQVVANGVNPVEIKATPLGLAFVDHQHMYIGTVPVDGSVAIASPTPAAVAYATIRDIDPWSPGGDANLTLYLDTNLEGREGITITWDVELLFGCSATSATCSAFKLYSTIGPKSLSFATPAHSGTIEAVAAVVTAGGAHVVETNTLDSSSLATSPCICTPDQRVYVSTLPPDTLSQEVVNGPGGASSSSASKLSSGAIAGIVVGSAVGAMIIAAAIYQGTRRASVVRTSGRPAPGGAPESGAAATGQASAPTGASQMQSPRETGLTSPARRRTAFSQVMASTT